MTFSLPFLTSWLKVGIVFLLSSDDKDDKIYKKIDGSNNVSDEVKDVTTDGFNVLDNVKKLNQYKYTFTYDKDSNNYVFNSIELVK